MDRPSYLRAAIEDWKSEQINTEQLCRIWQVSINATWAALSNEACVPWFDLTTDRIEEILEDLK